MFTKFVHAIDNGLTLGPLEKTAYIDLKLSKPWPFVSGTFFSFTAIFSMQGLKIKIRERTIRNQITHKSVRRFPTSFDRNCWRRKNFSERDELDLVMKNLGLPHSDVNLDVHSLTEINYSHS